MQNSVQLSITYNNFRCNYVALLDYGSYKTNSDTLSASM